MENPETEKENIIKDARNPFRLEKLKKAIDTTIKDIQNLFRLGKENKAIRNIVLRVVRNFFRMKKKIIINQ